MAGELWTLLAAHEAMVSRMGRSMSAEEAEYAYSRGLLNEDCPLCVYCGKLCSDDECDNNGEPIHNGENPMKLNCIEDREASKMDYLVERLKEGNR